MHKTLAAKQKILVTSAAGFIGNELSLQLVARGDDVLFDIDGLQISILTTFFAGTISFFVSSLWVFSYAKKGSK
jgi:hypothetical protein